MKKKIVFGLAMLIVLTASLSSQAAYVQSFGYYGNLSEQQFQQLIQLSKELTQKEFVGARVMDVNKLPNTVIQAINNNLRDYSLDTGDSFTSLVDYQKDNYVIILRITDARNSRWQFCAWRWY